MAQTYDCPCCDYPNVSDDDVICVVVKCAGCGYSYAWDTRAQHPATPHLEWAMANALRRHQARRGH
jgi:transcription elongation factor Elf1